jgi:hypothetical protein
MSKRANYAPPVYPLRDPSEPSSQYGSIIGPPKAIKLGGRGEKKIIDVAADNQSKMRVTDRGRGKGRK